MYNDNSFAEGYAIGRDSNNGYNNGMFGDGAWWIIILLLFGWGNNGNGFGRNNEGGFMSGYDLGKVATTNDVASGFSTSTIMSTQRDSQLAMQQGFSDVQQTLCQGFSGVNTSILTTSNATQNSISDLGFKLQDCCCKIERGIDGVNYNLSKATCDIIRAGQDNTQRILDYLTGDQIAKLRAENAVLTNQLSQNAQTNTIINTLRPVAQPAYLTCSPFQSVYGVGNCGCNCGC